MGALLGLGAALAYHDHRCRVSGKGALTSYTAEMLPAPFISQAKAVGGVGMA